MTHSTPLSRRAVLATVSSGILASLAGCSDATDLFPSANVREGPQSTAGPITGTVTDVYGQSLADARVEALDERSDRLAVTHTGSAGTFSLAVSRPVWLRITASGYLERVVAGRPGATVAPVLVGSSGTVALAFGGDVMFGRRFYEPSGDHLAPRAHIDPRDSTAQHETVLRGVEPLLQSADVSSINLESPLTRDLRHPKKPYTFPSHPAAAEALAEAGVDYAALGNNHAFDALDVGLVDTRRTLDSAGIDHSGAGLTSAEAWRPATTEVSGVSVAQISCTTLTGSQYDLHWSADDTAGRPTTVDTDAGSHTVSRGAGVAAATPARLARHVADLASRVDVVVVQIHGGEPYQRTPSDRIRRLTVAAADAGADLVVNHHPHVTGGIDRRGGTVIAWSMGNLVFDQTLWETMPTYLLTAYVTTDGVARVVVDPLLLEGFVPRGVVGKPNRAVTRQTAAYSDPEVRLTNTGLAAGDGTAPSTTATLPLAVEGSVYARRSGWIRGVRTGAVRLGRDLLPTGTFESVDVDSVGYDGPLWRFNRTPPATGSEFGADESGGVRLRRIHGNSANVLLSNTHRIPVTNALTLFARYRSDSTSGFTAEVAWYADKTGPAVSRQSWTLDQTGDQQWELLSRDLEVPDGATHLNVLFVLSPPNAGDRTAYLDDVRLVEWADSDVSRGKAYDHARVVQEATVDVAVPAAASTADWQRLDGL